MDNSQTPIPEQLTLFPECYENQVTDRDRPAEPSCPEPEMPLFPHWNA